MVVIAVLERVPGLYPPPPQPDVSPSPPSPDPAPPGSDLPGVDDPGSPAPQPPDIAPSPGPPGPIDKAGRQRAQR
jgi:hypothetical protein